MDTTRHSLVEHLEELRRAIIVLLSAIGAGAIIGYSLAPSVLEMIKRPLPVLQLVYFGPFDGFYLQLRLAVIIGLVLALPVIAACLVWFVGPGLTEKEKRIGYVSSIVALMLFCLGAVYALYVVLPVIITYLLGFSTAEMLPFVAAEEYLTFIFSFIVYCGMAFNLPLLMYLLVFLDVIPPALINRYRKAFVVAVVGCVLFFSPGGDLTSQLLMALPLYILFELSVFLAKIIRNFQIRGDKGA